MPLPPSATRGKHQPIFTLRELVPATAALVRRRKDMSAIWLRHRVNPDFREEIMIAVANANSCRHCSFAHREWALAEGVPAAEIAALEGLDTGSFDSRTWAAVAWAQALASSDFTGVPEPIDQNFRSTFTEQEQADIELIAQGMTFANRVGNTVDAALSRGRGKPVPGSGFSGEIAALLMFGSLAPLVILLLSAKQRRSPLGMLRSMRSSLRDWDVRAA
jgi:AhpD family alkylhydroperoxidase